MAKYFFALLISILFMDKLSAQTDSLPSDAELKKYGLSPEEIKTMKFAAYHFNDSITAMMLRGNVDTISDEEEQILSKTEQIKANPENIHILILDLSKENIDSLPDEIKNCENLSILILYNQPTNKNFDFNDAFEKIKGLKIEELYIINNKGFNAIPPSLGEVKSLKTLMCFNNAIKNVAPEIGKLSELETLSLEMNKITILPSSINKLHKLTFLGLDRNNLSNISGSINTLDNLRELNIRQCGLPENEIVFIKKTLPNCKVKSIFL